MTAAERQRKRRAHLREARKAEFAKNSEVIVSHGGPPLNWRGRPRIQPYSFSTRARAELARAGYAVFNVLKCDEQDPETKPNQERFKWLLEYSQLQRHLTNILSPWRRERILAEIGRLALEFGHDCAIDVADTMCAEKPATNEAIKQLRRVRLWMRDRDHKRLARMMTATLNTVLANCREAA